MFRHFATIGLLSVSLLSVGIIQPALAAAARVDDAPVAATEGSSSGAASRPEDGGKALPRGEAASLRCSAPALRPVIPALSWDTEGGRRSERNLLRGGDGVVLRWLQENHWTTSASIAPAIQSDARYGIRHTFGPVPGAEATWTIEPGPDRLVMRIGGKGAGWERIERLELLFPFDPKVTPTTVLPAGWADDGSCRLPAVINAPDFGQMLLTCQSPAGLVVRLAGSRAEKAVDLIIELPMPATGAEYTLELRPVWLRAPKGLQDEGLWRKARRGWFGAFQPSARWGDQGRPFSAPPGLLGNNVVSDPASVSVWFYADQALWTPEVAPGVSVAGTVRRTVDFWLDQRTDPSGEVIGYWDYRNFLDANAGPLIAAWDYVEATGDEEWLKRRVERLELVADFLAQRDVDGDGMVEAKQSGNRGTLVEPNRSCAWWDALNCGHKDGYTNALIYRSWRCLAELEGRIGRSEQQQRYTRLADRLKEAYAKTLLNPKTGWLAWWKSEDGELHDYASPVVNGLAIEYGLVPAEQGREILDKLHEKMREVRFTRFDLGVPNTLIPVLQADYLLHGAGWPAREDGTDSFQRYMNGGISAGQALHFIAAHYVVGRAEEGDRILRAMLERQSRGEFQNGVRDVADQGIDWTTWDGKACGYEGYLADSFRFLQAVVLREKVLRERYYRPLVGK